LFIFAGVAPLRSGDVKLHSLKSLGENLFGRKKEQVVADWERIVDQMQSLIDKAALTAKDFDLQEVTFELGFSAEGQIVFVAKAGIQTTIKATFKRRQAQPSGM
jgi:hypothetical protein